MTSTHLVVRLNVPREAVYRAFLDPVAIAAWMVPDGMTSRVHLFEPRVGGRFRVSLTYDAGGLGKSSADTDTYQGRFVELTRPSRIVQVLAFETADAAMQGEMTQTIDLRETEDGGCVLEALHANLPPGLSPADNETGWRMSLAKLAQLVEPGA